MLVVIAILMIRVMKLVMILKDDDETHPVPAVADSKWSDLHEPAIISIFIIEMGMIMIFIIIITIIIQRKCLLHKTCFVQ